jgi:MoaA/NifB/PqqE/SkfB family radical SAM enzyme
MPTELFHKIIDELAEIEFSGRISPHFHGEPLLDKRLVSLMSYVRKRLSGADIVIFTNGDYLTFKTYMELVTAGVDGFIVTQHSGTMPAGIKDLYSHFESPGLLPVPLQYLMYDDLTPLYNKGGLIDVSTTYPIPNCLWHSLSTITIDHGGNVVLCCNDYKSSTTFGNVTDKKLLDIWFDEYYTNIRKDLRKMNFRLPICKRCTENIDTVEMKNAYLNARIDSLEAPDSGTFLYDPLNLEKLGEIPDKTEFWVESIKSAENKQQSDKVLVIGGWAVDSSAGSPGAAVFITFDTGQEFRAYYPVPRPDVAAFFGNEGLRDSGFTAIVPMGQLPPGKRTFRLKIVTYDRAGFYYPPDEFLVESVPEKLQGDNSFRTFRGKNNYVSLMIERMQSQPNQRIPSRNRRKVLSDLLRIQKPITTFLGPQYRPDCRKIEIDITYRCNLKCFNCNRSCTQASSSIQMTIPQIRRFVDESKKSGKLWDTILISGGEPTLHPDLIKILNLLLDYRNTFSPGSRIEVVTNGYDPAADSVLSQIPECISLHNTKRKGVQNLDFSSVNIAPCDLASYKLADYASACRIAEVSGIGLTPFGYYPCALAGSIDRVFGFDLGMKQLPQEFTEFTDSFGIFCSICGHFKRSGEVPLDRPVQSRTWRDAYEKFRECPPILKRY